MLSKNLVGILHVANILGWQKTLQQSINCKDQYNHWNQLKTGQKYAITVFLSQLMEIQLSKKFKGNKKKFKGNKKKSLYFLTPVNGLAISALDGQK